MDYDKLIADAAAKLNSLVNEIIDTLDKAGTPVNPDTIINDVTAKAFPEKDGVVQVDEPASEVDVSDEEVTDEEPKQDDHFGEEQVDELKNLFAALKDDPGDSRWED